MFRYVLFALIAIAAFTASPLAHAQQIADDDGCTGPFTYPTLTFPNVCDIMPNLCDDEPPVFSTLVDALIVMGKQLWLVENGSIRPSLANQRIRNRAAGVLTALEATPEIRNQALNRISAANNTNLPRVAAHTMSVGNAMVEISRLFLEAAATTEQGEVIAQADGTVTTTTSAGFEFNLGIIKISANESVTTVESTDSDEGSGYTEECDEEGNCVCTEE